MYEFKGVCIIPVLIPAGFRVTLKPACSEHKSYIQNEQTDNSQSDVN